MSRPLTSVNHRRTSSGFCQRSTGSPSRTISVLSRSTAGSPPMKTNDDMVDRLGLLLYNRQYQVLEVIHADSTHRHQRHQSGPLHLFLQRGLRTLAHGRLRRAPPALRLPRRRREPRPHLVGAERRTLRKHTSGTASPFVHGAVSRSRARGGEEDSLGGPAV